LRVIGLSRKQPSIRLVTNVDPMFVDAARRHAVMYRLDHHPDANWPQRVMDCVGDLRCHFFLALEPLRERFDDAAQLLDPYDFVRR
jgi:hypothetical protein